MALRRSLNLFDATLLVVGNVVGAGIFTTSGFLAGELPCPWLFVGVWVIGGLLTLCGALTYAEMSSMFPRSGGDYLFLKAAYGPWAGFLLGWICFWIINPGSIAILSISIVKYLSGFFGSPGIPGEKLMAVATIAFFSLLNYRGVRLTGTVQNLWTLGSFAIIVFLILGGLAAGNGDWSHFSGNEPGLQPGSFPLTKLFGPAMIAVIFSYSGWFVTVYIGDEVKRPERNLPLSIFLGTLIVMMFYTLINVVYLYAISIADLKGVINVGQTASERLLSSGTAQIVSLAIILAIAASVNATMLAGTRLSYAMASDGFFWLPLKKLHPKYRTPYVAILSQAVISCLFVVVENFENLLNSVVFIMLLSSIGSGMAHLILRWREPLLRRPYQTWGYPYVPIFFIVVYSWIAFQIALSSPTRSLLGLLMTVSGIPFYLYMLSGNEEKALD
jgi:APA family basic amino acid/polyamine antiporter